MWSSNAGSKGIEIESKGSLFDDWSLLRKPGLNSALLLLVLVATLLGTYVQFVAVGDRPQSDAYLWFGDLSIETAPGVVMVDGLPRQTYVSGVEVSPLQIAQWGLEKHAQGDSAAAFRAADWLVANQTANGTWLYDFDYSNREIGVDLQGPWISSLAQGQALPLLVRAWKISGDDRYLKSGQTALQSFDVPVADGGVLVFVNGHPFYEEYPTATPTLVLNGFLFALIGLRDFAEATGNEHARRLWVRGERTAAAIIQWYSVAAHDSRYDLATNHLVRGSEYATIHVGLAHEMYRLTGRPVYEQMAEQWGPLADSMPPDSGTSGLLLYVLAGLLSALLVVRRRRMRRESSATTSEAMGRPE